MTEIAMIKGMIIEAVGDMITVAGVEIDDPMGVVATVNDKMTGGVAIEAKNDRKCKI
jgi:hypothetical protein